MVQLEKTDASGLRVVVMKLRCIIMEMIMLTISLSPTLSAQL